MLGLRLIQAITLLREFCVAQWVDAFDIVFDVRLAGERLARAVKVSRRPLIAAATAANKAVKRRA